MQDETIISLQDLPPNSRNILNLDDPSQYGCQLWQYNHGHSTLALQIGRYERKHYDPIFMLFDAVIYVNAPMGWLGADLCIASGQEYIQTIKSRRLLSLMPDDVLPLNFRLVRFEDRGNYIEFIAPKMSIVRGTDSLNLLRC